MYFLTIFPQLKFLENSKALEPKVYNNYHFKVFNNVS